MFAGVGIFGIMGEDEFALVLVSKVAIPIILVGGCRSQSNMKKIRNEGKLGGRLMHYKFCPECGLKLIDKLAGDEGNVPFCTACNRYWFDSFNSCSIMMVVNEMDEVALLTQKYLSDKYKTFVSGYITPGETAEETAIREVREEIGIEIECLEYAGTYWFEAKGLLMHGYIGYASKSAFKLSKEVDDAEWVSVSEIETYIFPESPGNAMHPIYRRYLESK